MPRAKAETVAPNGHGVEAQPDAPEQAAPATESSDTDNNEFAVKAATVGAIVVGAALIETALIPGMIVGAAAVMAPKYLPKLGTSLEPLFKKTVRGAYKFGQKTKHAFAEAKEQVNDIVAEVDAEHAAPKA